MNANCVGKLFYSDAGALTLTLDVNKHNHLQQTIVIFGVR